MMQNIVLMKFGGCPRLFYPSTLEGSETPIWELNGAASPSNSRDLF
jgi:hypothetical protein